jgi:RNA-directed DNA polymerase
MSNRKRRLRPADWPDWFEPKGYVHFDQPIRHPNQIRALVESSAQVARHPFLPFIHFEKVTRKFKRDKQGFVKKTRPLSYASHTDSQIFRRYCLLLSEEYEKWITQHGLGESVVAYRRLRPPKCNIHFANDAFQFIEATGPCLAMAFDVRDFFESLDHKHLKQNWKSLLGVRELPPDHYAVFKAVTRYAWVERVALFKLFGITKKKLKGWRGPICTPGQFRQMVRSSTPSGRLIKTKTDSVGIPQGSPISALLSNLYMMPVDVRMATLAKTHGGVYKRYSDDILIVCPLTERNALEGELRRLMANVGLLLHEGAGKAVVAQFSRNDLGGLECDRPLQYLGFTFDGKKVRVRSQTVARYLRRMRKAVRREKYLGTRNSKQESERQVRRKRLYSRYTHLGRNNFITYTKNARAVFKDSEIREQMRNHWDALHAALRVE